MKLARALGASVLLLSAAPAAAQVYPGEEVTVNSAALGHGYLLYPGGKYGRHVGALLQPGEKPGAVIHLHMPPKHPRRAARTASPPATAPAIDTLTAPDTAVAAAPPPRRHHPQRTAAAAPPPAATAPTAAAAPPPADINALPEDSAARLMGGPSNIAPPPKPPVRPAPHATAAPPPADAASPSIPFSFSGSPPAAPRRTASATPPPANTSTPAAIEAGLKKQSVIPFAVGASSPASADVNAIHTLATSLNAALNAGASRVQLQAYGGPHGDKSSDARRLSLKRALVVRELLIEDGVPSEKIDVRAMGGADDNGVPDRVDVFLRA